MPHPELSLRHLPDLSNDSFQIPTTIHSGDLLLADQSDLFFRDAGGSLITPALERYSNRLPSGQQTQESSASIPSLNLASTSRESPKRARRAVVSRGAIPELRNKTSGPSHYSQKENRAGELFEKKDMDNCMQTDLGLHPHSIRRSHPKLERSLGTNIKRSHRNTDIDAPPTVVMEMDAMAAPSVTCEFESGTSTPKGTFSGISGRDDEATDGAGSPSTKACALDGVQTGATNIERLACDTNMVKSSSSSEYSSMDAGGGGVVERSDFESQSLMTSMSMLSSQQETPAILIGSRNVANLPSLPTSDQSPPTTSQISQKTDNIGESESRVRHTRSPMRPSAKRNAERQLAKIEQRDPKRSKTDSDKAEVSLKLNKRRPSRTELGQRKSAPKRKKDRALQPSFVLNSAASGSNSQALIHARAATQNTEVGAMVRAPDNFNSVPSTSKPLDKTDVLFTETMDLAREKQRSTTRADLTNPTSSGNRYRLRSMERSEREGVSLENDEEEKKDFKVTGLSYVDKTSAPRPLKSTIPQEFHFRSNARAEVRRHHFPEKSGTSQKQETAQHSTTIPDFKALHAVQEALNAARKEQIMPIIPGHLELNTEARVKNREKFEEARRARETELERQEEERRLLRLEEEEKEYKELRKRTIPKANTVPDWYADAPKKNSKSASFSGFRSGLTGS